MNTLIRRLARLAIPTLTITTLAALTLILLPTPTLAECEVDTASGIPCEILGEDGILALVANTLRGLILISAVGALIWAAILYSTGGASEANITTSKTIIKNTLLGVLVFSAFDAIGNFLIPVWPGNSPGEIFLGIPAWHAAIDADTGGAGMGVGGAQDAIGTIIGSIILFITRVIVIVAIGFITYGGFLIASSRGNPDGVARGKKAITNALIGIIIAILATSVVSTIMSFAFEDVDAIRNIVISHINFAVGVAVVVCILYGGFLYVTSAGDPSKAAQAKKSIIYALAGAVVAVSAGIIINFVVGNIAT